MVWLDAAMDRRRLIALAAALAAPGLMAAAPKEEKAKLGATSYVEIQPLAATILRANGRRGVLTVQAGLDVPDAKLRARAESVVPRLRAAFAQSVQAYAAGLGPATAPNADLLAIALQRDADRVLGAKGARLLLGTILVN
jgi:hypothetical protein